MRQNIKLGIQRKTYKIGICKRINNRTRTRNNKLAREHSQRMAQIEPRMAGNWNYYPRQARKMISNQKRTRKNRPVGEHSHQMAKTKPRMAGNWNDYPQ